MSFGSRWKKTLNSKQSDTDIEDELRYHLAMREQEGVDPRVARIRFGNTSRLKEEVRAQQVLPWLESVARDVRHALRQIHRTPLFTLVIVLSLALGIGTNSAIFSLIDAALLKPLPVPGALSLRRVEWTSHGFPPFCNMMSGDRIGDRDLLQGYSISERVYRDLARQQNGFASLIGFSDYPSAVAVAFRRRPARQFHLQYASSNFFSGLGVPLQIGRTFSSAEDHAGQPPLVILSDRFWRKEFAADPHVLGQFLRVNNISAEIVGVAPPGFFGMQIGQWVDLYAPLAAQNVLSPTARLAQTSSNPDLAWWVRMVGRLKPGASDRQALEPLAALFPRLLVPTGASVTADKIPKLTLLPGQRGVDPLGADEARALWLLFLFVTLILLIVCANVANLLLSRVVARQRESAIALAMGASRVRLFRKHLTESLLLSAVGGTAGLLLGYVLAHALHAFIRADMDTGGFELQLNAQVLAFNCTSSFATALLCGIAPAWTLARASVHDVLKNYSRHVASGRLRLPRLLVVAQIGLSLIVLVAAGLLSRSLLNLHHVDIGFNASHIVYAAVNPWNAGYQPGQVDRYVARLRIALAAIPGVRHAATVESRPLSGDQNSLLVNIPGHSGSTVATTHVGDGFFETLGIPLVAGRTFTPADMGSGSNVVIVDDVFAQRFFSDRNPLNQQFGNNPNSKTLYRIIGVVRNSRYRSLRGAAGPGMFLPSAAATRPGAPVNFVVQTKLSATQISQAIRRAAVTADPAVPVVAIQSQSELIDSTLRTERLLSVFSAAFGLLALLLSAIGLGGLLAYTVARRKSEIGIRMALGAGRSSIGWMVVRNALVLVLIGLAVGFPGAIAIGRILRHTIFNLQPLDPTSVLLSLASMLLFAAFASWIPARHAARIDPLTALREE